MLVVGDYSGVDVSDEDIIGSLEALKTAVIQEATGGKSEMSDAQYRTTRKALLSHPELGPHVPEWLRRGTTLWEARILFKLSHPGIVKVYDVGMIGRRPCIRMEYLQGRTLTQAIRDGAGLAIPDARYVTSSLADAFAHAHGIGVVHRDLKPSNIM